MMTVGTLEIKSKKNKRGNVKKTYKFSYMNSEGQYRSLGFDKIAKDQISPELLQKIEDSSSVTLTVEFEEEGDRIIKLREQGIPWPEDISEPVAERSRPTDKPKIVTPNNFHNPYNFVPALPRDSREVQASELGDHKPSGHGRYLPNRWSGRISVKLTTVTPLLIPDAAEMTNDNGHKTYSVRLGADGKPYLPPTSLKGMLRSAYEAVTNSRLSVLDQHDARLAYRMPAKIGLQMVPARIEGEKAKEQIKLYPGTSGIGNDGRPQGAMYAAWLPRYDRNTNDLRFEVRYPDRALPQHGDHVKFWAEKYGKYKRNNPNPIFTYWKVRAIAKYEDNLPQKPEPSNGYGNHRPTGNEIREFKGYVYVTNKNIDNKHDERVFIVNNSSITVALTSDLKKKWQELISNYQEEHKDEIKKGLNSPPALNRSRWSRQVVAGEVEQRLRDGSLCYAHVEKENGQIKVLDLYPVMITRGLFKMAPLQLLDQNLRPATQKDQLSPADRVFGWVNQQGKGSYKGHLRIHSVSCTSDDPLDNFSSEAATWQGDNGAPKLCVTVDADDSDKKR